MKKHVKQLTKRYLKYTCSHLNQSQITNLTVSYNVIQQAQKDPSVHHWRLRELQRVEGLACDVQL